jgi:hypothetical protein
MDEQDVVPLCTWGCLTGPHADTVSDHKLLHVKCNVIVGTGFRSWSAELRICTFPGAWPAHKRVVFWYRLRNCFSMTILQS